MAAPPITGSLPESALFEYFSGIAAAVALPLIVQDDQDTWDKPFR